MSAENAADVTVIASSKVNTMSKLSPLAYSPAVKSADKTFAAPRVEDSPPIATNISESALVLSFPLAAVPALSSQPLSETLVYYLRM